MCCLTSALKLAEGMPIVLTIFLAGVLRIMELQEQGYAYVPS
jgi:intracellular sulfur oxidation DsrE/DsrF family protein